MSWLSLWRPSETRSLMNQAQQILRIHSLNTQESHEKELSCKKQHSELLWREHPTWKLQPSPCDSPAWALWLLPWAEPWWRCRSQVNFSVQHWAGKHHWVAWSGTAAFSMVLCVFVSPRHSHTYSQPAVQGIPPSPGLCLPSYGQVQKTAAEENQIMNKHSELTLNACGW